MVVGLNMRKLVLLMIVAALGCAPVRQQIVVPAHMRATPKEAAGLSRRDKSDKVDPPRQSYRLRIDDAGRSYWVDFPPTAGGYEVRVPLTENNDAPLPRMDEDGDIEIPKGSLAFKQRMVEIRALFARQSYDIADFELSQLLKAHPDDAQLLAMQGSLEWKRGNKEAARAIWQRVIDLDPMNVSVLEMLEDEQ